MIAVVGASGLIGRHLLQRLPATDEVRALRRPGEAVPPGLFAHALWATADLLKPDTLARALEGVTKVYNCAGLVSYDPRDADRLMRVNADGTANLVEACVRAGVRRLLHVSSSSTLARDLDGHPVDEDTPRSPDAVDSAYARSKRAAEAIVLNPQQSGPIVNCVNPTVVLGNGDWATGSTRYFKEVFDGSQVYPPGSIGFVDVLDVADAMIAVMNSDARSERFIVNGHTVSYATLFRLIASAFGVAPPRRRLPRWSGPVLITAGKVATRLGIKGVPYTRDLVETLMADIRFEDRKLRQRFPELRPTPLDQTVARVCSQLLERHAARRGRAPIRQKSRNGE